MDCTGWTGSRVLYCGCFDYDLSVLSPLTLVSHAQHYPRLLIALAGLVMIAAGAWDLFTKGTASARLRHYAIAIGMICGGLAMGGLAQALRLLLEINAKGG